MAKKKTHKSAAQPRQLEALPPLPQLITGPSQLIGTTIADTAIDEHGHCIVLLTASGKMAVINATIAEDEPAGPAVSGLSFIDDDCSLSDRLAVFRFMHDLGMLSKNEYEAAHASVQNHMDYAVYQRLKAVFEPDAT